MQVQGVDWLIGWLCGLLLRDLMQVQLTAPVSFYNALLKEKLSTTDVAKLTRAIARLNDSQRDLQQVVTRLPFIHHC